MNLTELLPRLRSSFNSCVADGANNVIRCEHRVNDRIRSIYFFCPVDALPSLNGVKELQERVVAPSFFNATDESRWNHFLVYVLAKREVPDQGRSSRRIETDKTYARKLVVLQEDLDGFLGLAATDDGGAVRTNELQETWMQTLADAGLAAIASQDARASTLRNIRAGILTSAPPRISDLQSEPEPAPVTLRQIDIKRFGVRSLRGKFELGIVNLIRGPNGAGKTSFLEAIEHYFCGATFRGGGAPEEMDTTVTFSNGRSVAFSQRRNSYYQSKELAWYGRTTNRGTKLCEGFSRYHFLNTDAAADLSKDPSLRNIKDALAKVALGPDASYTWNRILEFDSDITRLLITLNNEWAGIEQRRHHSQQRLEALQTPSPQIVVQISALNSKLSQLGWPSDGRPVSTITLADFSRFQPLTALSNIRTPGDVKSVDDLARSIDLHREDSELLKALDLSQRTILSERANLQLDLPRVAESRLQVDRLTQYVQLRFGERLATQRNCKDTIATLSSFTLSQDELGRLRELTALFHPTNSSLADVIREVEAALIEERHTLQSQIQARVQLEARASERTALLGQLRSLGRHYAEQNPDSEACPICSSAMTAHELIQRLDLAIESDASHALNDISLAIASSEPRVAELQECHRLLNELLSVDNHSQDWTWEEAIQVAWQRLEARGAAETELAAITSELSRLAGEGFKQDDYQFLLRACLPDQSTGDAGNLDLPSMVSAASNALEEKLRAIGDRLNELQSTLDGQGRDVAAIAKRYGAPSVVDAVDRAIRDQLEDKVALDQALRSLPPTVLTSQDQNIEAVITGAKAVCLDLESISERIRQEHARDEEMKVLESSLAQDQLASTTQKAEIDRLESAQRTLHWLKEHHSLDQGLADFLAANQRSIQHIFSRIHVPNELRLSTLADCRLERIATNSSAELSQISTGQRAALTLSVFLALNQSLRAGPPIMLIDDPVAHIDDLNSLALLDYLADIAETGARQIFFATADDRLANLFVKKMGFLGTTNFREIDLTPGIDEEEGHPLH